MQQFLVLLLSVSALLGVLLLGSGARSEHVQKKGDGWVWWCDGACGEARKPAATRSGFQLAGGSTDSPEAFRFSIARAGGGDFLVLRSTGGDGYNKWVYDLGGVHSAQTLLINETVGADDPFVKSIIESAAAIFFAGGDQFNYVRFFNSSADNPVRTLVNEHIEKRRPIGGTSAGLAIQGEYLFTAEFNSVTSREALADPGARNVAIGRNFLRDELLLDVITDSHFAERDRMGRLVAFIARIQFNGWSRHPRGLGVDERVSLLLDGDTGRGRVVAEGNEDGAIYCLEALEEPSSGTHAPLSIRKVVVHRVRTGGEFDVKHWRPVDGDPRTITYELSAASGVLKSEGNGGNIY